MAGISDSFFLIIPQADTKSWSLNTGVKICDNHESKYIKSIGRFSNAIVNDL
jgi:hypothetical protein